MTSLRTSALTLAALIAAGGVARAEVKQGDRALDLVQVVDAAGHKVSLRQFDRQVIVMTFGASWCGPCKKELPAYEKLARRYKERRAPVVFLAVNIDNDAAKARAFVKGAGLREVRALFDRQKSTVESYDPPKMPSTFVIRRGIVRHVQAGYDAGDEARLAAAIDRELGAK